MTGMARKNVNSAATVREQPRMRPPMIVEPEREVPGTMESTWKTPIADGRLPVEVIELLHARVGVGKLGRTLWLRREREVPGSPTRNALDGRRPTLAHALDDDERDAVTR